MEKKIVTTELVKKPLIGKTELVKKTKLKTKSSKNDLPDPVSTKKVVKEPKIKLKNDDEIPFGVKSADFESAKSSEKSSEHCSDNMINVNSVADQPKNKITSKQTKLQNAEKEIKLEKSEIEGQALESGVVVTGVASEQNQAESKSSATKSCEIPKNFPAEPKSNMKVKISNFFLY